MIRRPALIEAIEGYYVTSILSQLHELGIMRSLGEDADPQDIARRFDIDPGLLINLLDYLALGSDVVDCIHRGDQKRYRIRGNGVGDVHHLLEQYVGAYGPCLRHIPEILRSPAVGEVFVDRLAHAAAFSDDGGAVPGLLAFVHALRIDVLLDVGCGGGQFLFAIAQAKRRFRGLGIDANAHMIAQARRRAARLRVAGRVKFQRLPSSGIAGALGKHGLRSIQAVSAVNVANSFFGSGESIDQFLAGLRTLLPGRILLLCDYYSRLGTAPRRSGKLKKTLVHDVAQLLSSQGLPPSSLGEWRRIYARNGIKLLHAEKSTDDGVCWFTHIARL